MKTLFTKKRLILSLLIVSNIMSSCICKQDTEQDTDIIIFSMTPTLTTEELRWCKKRVIEYGDVEAYDSLVLHYFYPDILPWALIMANKYGNPDAPGHVYISLEQLSPTKTLDDLDEDTRHQALIYLNLSVERGHYYNAKELAKFYYEGKYVPLDSLEANRLMGIYNSGKLKEKETHED